MASQAAMGQKALEARQYRDAIKHYSEALKSSNSPLWLIQRSIAYHREGSFDLALCDAEEAVLAAISRGRRELMATAQLRRAIALFSLKRYGDARICFTWVRKLNEKEKGLGMWQAKVVMEYDKLPEDAEGRKTTIKETPDKPAPIEDSAAKEKQAASTAAVTPTTAQQKAPAPNTVAPTAQTPKEKIRHEWYQSSNKVTITIFAKGVPKDQAEIEFGSQSLDVRFPLLSSGSTYDFTLLPLFASIDVAQSTYSITPNKIEINLHKTASGLKWPALEGTETPADVPQKTEEAAPVPKVLEPTDSTTADKAPSYPTSSRKGAKDWDAVAKDALKKENKKDSNDVEADAGAEGDDDYDDTDPLQGFFKKLYKDASPDTRRAMMKSYVESNGTALSTNWEDVGKKTVETTPPEGLEAKKWEA